MLEVLLKVFKKKPKRFKQSFLGWRIERKKISNFEKNIHGFPKKIANLIQPFGLL